MEETDCDRNTCTACHGLQRLSRLSLRLFNTWGISQQTKDIVVSPFKRKLALVYLDDNIISLRNTDQCIDHICTVLSLLHRTSVILSLKMQVVYIENWLPGRCDTTQPINAFSLLQRRNTLPKTTINGIVPEVFLSTAWALTLCSKLCPNCCPLIAQLRTGWTKPFQQLRIEEMNALRTLQQNLLLDPVLALPGGGDIRLGPDAWNEENCSMLEQHQPDRPKKPLGIGPELCKRLSRIMARRIINV